MMKEIHTIEQLKIALKISEAHARTCTVQYYNTPHNFIKQNEPGFLAINVSPKMVRKAVKVLGLFLTRLIRQGVFIDLETLGSYGYPSSSLVLDGDHFPIRIKEKFEYREVKHVYGISTEKSPTGRLVIEIYRGTHSRPAKTIVADNEEELPDKADGVLLYMKAVIDEYNAHKEEYELWQRQREEEERAQKEKERILRERAATAKSIIEDIRLFERAQAIRNFCSIAARRSSSEKYKKALDIALSVADWIDPTTDYTDAILAERYSASDFI